MSKRASATPYAKALFEVALAAGTVEEVGRDVDTVAALFAEHAELARALTHPAVPPRAKRTMVERLAGEANLSAPVRRLLALMADRDRLALVPELRRAYRARLMQHQGVVEAHVTTAVPIAPERAEAIASGLQRATGKSVHLSTSVDPRIMGGVVARIGSRVFDGSVTRQLERLRDELVSRA
jgi:F-type H+-transporting ATPase subunit delta